MTDFLVNWYLWIKAFHVIAVITWMAGNFYLPRLYVYHVEGLYKKGVVRGSDMDLLFQHQERLLLKAIMNPAMIATWVFGLLLVFTPGVIDWGQIWPWTKAVGVLAMSGYHGWLAKQRKAFVAGTNKLTGRQYRLMNEVPTILLLVIVISVFVKF
ncbi:CopD family protein [Thioclava sp. BHET1]|nr:CopD family protein [Thioclava sp. BHET1]